MCSILEHKSSCTESDPRSIQLFSAFSSGLIGHWCEELLAFICCELAMSWLLSLHPTGSEDTVDNYSLYIASMPLMILQISVILFLSHIFFTRKTDRLLSRSLYHSFSDLFSTISFQTWRYQPSIQYSRYRHTVDLHMTEWCLFFSCVLYFQFFCPVLVISSNLVILAITEDW